ncbi:hypothetical protein HDU91_003494, partial [Kappamyces sp. JEL0680]
TAGDKRFVVVDGFSIEVTKTHGPFYNDDYFGTVSWSADSRFIVYVAEKPEPSDDSKFALEHDAGEGYTGKRKACICLVDVHARSVKLLDNLPGLFGVSQPLFAGDSIYFVGILEDPVRLGIKFCTNRRTVLCSIDYSSADPVWKQHSQEGRSVRFPQLSPDGKSLVYLSNPVGGPHDSCAQLISFDIASHKETVVVDTVSQPAAGEFPGLFAVSLKANSWAVSSSNEPVLLVTSLWRSRSVILAVNIATGAVDNVAAEGTESWTLLGCTNGQIVATKSSPSQMPSIVTKRLSQLHWDFVDGPPVPKDVQEMLAQVSHSICSVPERGPNVKVVFVRSKAKIHSFASHVSPLICMPHG